MVDKSKTLAFMITCLLLLSTLSATTRNLISTAQPPNTSELTGTIADSGEDTDGNGKYDFLEVAVEINVSDPGTYRIVAYSLMSDYSYLYLYTFNESSLSPGIQSLNLSFHGPAIYGAYFNPMYISLDLYWMHDGYQELLDGIPSAPLSRTYNYTEFDCAATLTGIVHDQEVDMDSDGLFDALQLGIEINVVENATYIVEVSGLTSNFTYVPVYNSSAAFLTTGIMTVNVSLYGPTIFANLHDSEGNVSGVNYFSLRVQIDFDSYQIDSRYNVLLSRQYAYYEFESHAYFTGRVFDNGVDENSDGFFESLNVGVEVNVTEAGSYVISVQGLRGVKNGALETIYIVYQSLDLDLNKTVHMINFTYSGPMIAFYHLNPTNITGISLIERRDYYNLNYTPVFDLPTKYSYTQFNSPLANTELEFMVYPNATIGVKGNHSQTNIYPPLSGPRTNVTLSLSTVGNLTTGSASGTMAYPEELSDWPFNSTTARLLASYSSDMLDAQLNVAMTMPPAARDSSPFNSSAGDLAFNAAYSNGVVRVDLTGTAGMSPESASQFPFNVSDLRLLVDYANRRYKGNVTLHVIGGFPLGDVTANIDGNETALSLTGYVNVTYSNLFGEEVNYTFVSNFIALLNNLTGQGDQSLYNLTGGMVEFTSLELVRTNTTYGEMVDYTATLSGNLTYALAQLVVGSFSLPSEAEQTVYGALNATFSSVQNGTLRLNFYNASKIIDFDLTLYSDVKKLWNDALQLIPSTIPDEGRSQVDSILRIANATAYAISNTTIQATYSADQQKLDVTASLRANVTQLKGDIIPFISNASLLFLPPEFGDAFNSYANTTYSKLSTFTLSSNYTDGLTEFDADWTLQGDFKAQVNHAKSLLIILLNTTGSGFPESTARLFNATEVDVNNLTADVREGVDWMTMTFDGVRLAAQKDEMDQVRFKLYQWLNMTNDPEAPPHEFEKLKITVTSGFNGTHTVLLYAPSTLPTHATALDYKTMTWDNTTMSSLGDLVFQIAYQGIVNYGGNTYYVPVFTNSTVSEFSFNSGLKRISFNVTGATGSGFINVTIPRALTYAALDAWIVRVDSSQVTFNVTENGGFVFLYLNYSHSTHMIEIFGTWIIPEFHPDLLAPILIVLGLIAAAVAVKQRRKLRTLKARYAASMNAFVVKIRQLRT
jgi:hypothetical protein